MKKYLFVISVVAVLFFMTACDTSFMYNSDGSLEQIKQKTTMQSFEQLNEPIVISMPVYEDYYLFGNKNFDSRQKRAGDMIVVIDIETNTVYDWVFFSGEHGWAIWRLVEAGSNPTRYLMSCPGTGEVATVDPRNIELTVTYTGFYENFWCWKVNGTKAPMCYGSYNTELHCSNYHTQLFDCETNTLSETDICVPTLSVGFITTLRSDYEGNSWISYQHPDNTTHVQKINKNTEIMESSIATFEKYPDSYAIECISDEYVFIGYQTYDDNFTGLIIINLKNGEKIEVSGIKESSVIQYVYDIQKVNNDYYAIVPTCIGSNLPRSINIYKIDLENKSAFKEISIPFDMTENVYVRGSRIYFMRSRNLCNITYTYYDTETGEVGEVVPVKQSKIIEDYLKTIK